MAEQANNEKRLIINRHTVWTIPNILVFIRILCVPVYMTLLILGSRANETNNYQQWWIYVAIGVMAFAAFTDLIDGKIARRFPAGSKFGKHTVKYSQGTYVGQVLDPIGDKTMHIGVLLGLCIAGQGGSHYLHWAFLVALIFRELCMVVIGSVLVNDINVQANMLGKVASAIISVSAILCFFHEIWFTKLVPGWTVYTLDWVLLTIGIVLNWAAAINYAVDAARQLKASKAKKAAEEAAKANGEKAEQNEENTTKE